MRDYLSNSGENVGNTWCKKPLVWVFASMKAQLLIWSLEDGQKKKMLVVLLKPLLTVELQQVMVLKVLDTGRK